MLDRCNTSLQLRDIIANEAYYYCTTTDIWTSRMLTAFICFTIHYLTEDFTMKSWNIVVQKIPQKHTGDRIANWLEEAEKRPDGGYGP